MARDPSIAYVLLRNAHFGPKGAASVELCVRDFVRHSRYAASTLVVCPKVEDPFDGIAIETVPEAALRRQSRQSLERRTDAAAARGRRRDRREPPARRRVGRVGRPPARDPAQPRLRKGGREPPQADRPRRRARPHFGTRLRERGLRQPVSPELPEGARADARGAERARHGGMVRRGSEGKDDPFRRPRARRQGPCRGDGGDHAPSAVETRLAGAVHPVGDRQGAQNRAGASRGRGADARAGDDRDEPALRRGQGGVGEGRPSPWC